MGRTSFTSSSKPAKTGRWRWILAASLGLNALLGYGLWKKTPDTRAYYQQLWTWRTPRMAPEPPATVLAPTPKQPLELAAEMVRDTAPNHAYRGQKGADFTQWQQGGRSAFQACLGFAPRPLSGNPIVVSRSEYPTFTKEKLFLPTDRGIWLPAYMLTPKGVKKPRPAVLALPGHDSPADVTGRGAASIVGRDSSQNYMRSFGLRLAEAGYVVLAVDVAGVGELVDLNYLRLVREGLLVGVPLKRMMLEEVHQAMDYLVSRPEVDTKQVGTVGMSLGGELAMFAGILDPRVRFVVSSGFFYSYRDYHFTSAASLFIPGILNVGDIPDLAGLVAPRPMMLQVATKDAIIQADKLGPYFATTQSAYQASGAPHAVTLDLFPEGHVMGAPQVVDWMKKHVPISEQPL